MWNDTVIESVRRAGTDTLDLRELGLRNYDISDNGKRIQAIANLLEEIKYRETGERTAIVSGIARAVKADLPENLMMTHRQVAQLAAAGMAVGAHTVNHPILARLDDARAESEIRESRRQLENITGAEIRMFAYPNGRPGRDYTLRDVALVKKSGMKYAVSTDWACATPSSDPLQIPRIMLWEKAPWRFYLRLLRGYYALHENSLTAQ
jgi:peptidoglycan/xylan/chitin deacetylase (PgdA/CDA1 family)